MIRNCFFAFCFSFLCLSAFAQNQITVSLSKDSIKIGEITEFSWKLSVPDSLKLIALPEIPDSLPSGIEVVSTSDVKSDKKTNVTDFNRTYQVSVYDSGNFVIPQLSAYFVDKHNDTLVLNSDSLFLYANTLPIDTAAGFKAIKDIYDVQPSFSLPIWVWIVISVVVLLVAAFFVWRYFRKKKKGGVLEPEIYVNPADEALEKLNAIKENRRWTTVSAKSFYTEITGILRRYILREFNVQAEEMVSDEIIGALTKLQLSYEAISRMKRMLRLSDYVKFAKYKPVPENFEESLGDSIAFVELTRTDKSDKGGDNVQ